MQLTPSKSYSEMTPRELLIDFCAMAFSGFWRWHAIEREQGRITDEMHKRQLCVVRSDNPKRDGHVWAVMVIRSDEDRDIYPDDWPTEFTDTELGFNNWELFS